MKIVMISIQFIMSNNLMHIGLSVIEKDVDEFYIGVMNGTVIKSFELPNEESYLIFKIKKDVKIVYVLFEGIVWELFINDKYQLPTFSHVCFQSDQIEDIVERAKLKGYSTHKRNNNIRETYFISDSNFNLFEIKTKV